MKAAAPIKPLNKLSRGGKWSGLKGELKEFLFDSREGTGSGEGLYLYFRAENFLTLVEAHDKIETGKESFWHSDLCF